jgi:hypothetical protein
MSTITSMTTSEREDILRQVLKTSVSMCRQWRQWPAANGEHYYYMGLCTTLIMAWEDLIITTPTLEPYRGLDVEDMFPKIFEKLKQDLGSRNYLYPLDAAGYESRKIYVKELIENVHKYV